MKGFCVWALTACPLTVFANNWQTIKKKFKLHHSSTKRLAALLYAIDNKPIDCIAIRECHSLIKKNTGIFSAFRGNMVLGLAAMLSLKENRKDIFARTVSVYKMLKKEGFRASDYLAVAAYEIASNEKLDDYQQIARRARVFYKGMKANSFFRTGEDDYIFSAMLGLSDIEVEDGIERIELLYQRFKSEFWSKNSIQMLVQILVLGEESDLAVDRVLA
jgi:hypothetical protein